MDYKASVRDIMNLIEKGATGEEIRARASQIKTTFLAEYQAMAQSMSAVDNLIWVFAPDPAYTWGFFPQVPAVSTGTVSSTPPREPGRREKALNTAKKQAEGSENSVVTARAVAEQLQRDGDQTPLKNLIVSVGNILARSTEWTVVKPGTYRLWVKEEKE